MFYKNIYSIRAELELPKLKVNDTVRVIAFPKGNSGVIVQLDTTNITCLVRIPARFNNYPHYLDNVLIKITEIKEDKKLIYGYLMRILS